MIYWPLTAPLRPPQRLVNAAEAFRALEGQGGGSHGPRMPPFPSAASLLVLLCYSTGTT